MSILFALVPVGDKTPDIKIYDDDDREMEFAVIDNEQIYAAKWDHEQLSKDQFNEKGNITWTIENWFFFSRFSRWLQRSSRQNAVVIIDNYDNGTFRFRQSINRPRIFQFDISVIVLVKHTKNLKIMYTSSILSFIPKLFSSFTRESALLEYCNLWLTESNELIDHKNLQTCPCTIETLRFDPDYISDPTCSSTSIRICRENINASYCYLKPLNVA